MRGILEHFWEDFLRESRRHFLPVGIHSSASPVLLGANPWLDAGQMGVKERHSALEELMVSRWRSHTQTEGDQRVIGCDGDLGQSGQADSGSGARRTWVQILAVSHTASVISGRCVPCSESQLTDL